MLQTAFACSSLFSSCCPFFFFFNDTATTEIYTLSLHDALPLGTPAAQFLQLPRNGHFQRKQLRAFVDSSDLCHRKAARLHWQAPLLGYHLGLKHQRTSRGATPSCCGAADRGRTSALRIRTRPLRLYVIRLLETRRPEQCGSARLLIQSHVPSAIEPSHRAYGPA